MDEVYSKEHLESDIKSLCKLRCKTVDKYVRPDRIAKIFSLWFALILIAYYFENSAVWIVCAVYTCGVFLYGILFQKSAADCRYFDVYPDDLRDCRLSGRSTQRLIQILDEQGSDTIRVEALDALISELRRAQEADKNQIILNEQKNALLTRA